MVDAVPDPVESIQQVFLEDIEEDLATDEKEPDGDLDKQSDDEA